MEKDELQAMNHSSDSEEISEASVSQDIIETTDTDRRKVEKTPRRIAQNYVVVWLDADLDESTDDFRYSFTRLQSIVHTIETYTDADLCAQCVSEIHNEKFFMIVSDALSQAFVPSVHHLPQVDAIFIFARNDASDHQWTSEWSKVKGVFTRIDFICDGLRQAAHLCDQNSVSVSILSASEASSNPNLIQLDPTFMYTQLLKETLLEINFDEVQSVKAFVEF